MSNTAAGSVCESEVDFLARAVIAQHGPAAAYAAEHHLDQLVQWSSSRCDTWTAVVDAIHHMRCRLDTDSREASGPEQIRQLTPTAR
jgi:hypothetical protein